MTAEQAAMLADENSPAFMVGAFEIALAAIRIIDRLEWAFRGGEGIG